MHNIDLKQMEVFMAVVDAGGLSAAQARLGVGISAISKTLSDLEVRVKCQLCERGRGGFRITAAGQHFYDAANRFKFALDTYQEEVFSIHNKTLEMLRFGAVDNVLQDPNNPIINLLLEVQQQHPVKVITFIEDPLELSERLINGQLDLVLSHRKETASVCQCYPLYKEQLVLVMGNKQHGEYQGSDLSLDQWVERFGIWSFKSARELHEIPELSFLPGAEILDLGLKNHLEEVLWQVLMSQAVAILPYHFAKNSIDEGHIVIVSDQKRPILSSMFINYKLNSTHKQSVKDIIDRLS